MSDDRDRGIEFGDLQDDLESEEYPRSVGALLARYGDHTLQYANRSVTLRELPGKGSEDTYASPGSVHQSAFTVGDYAEGREDYTDREPNARGEDYEQQSF